MTNGYDKMDIDADDKFLKINANESVQINLISKEPTKQVSHWINKKKTACLGKACELCENGDQPRHNWKTQVLDRKSNTIKDWEFGKSIAIQIKEIAAILAENQQTIHDVDLRIKRVGATQFDTEYFVNQVPKKTVQNIADESEVPF